MIMKLFIPIVLPAALGIGCGAAYMALGYTEYYGLGWMVGLLFIALWSWLANSLFPATAAVGLLVTGVTLWLTCVIWSATYLPRSELTELAFVGALAIAFWFSPGIAFALVRKALSKRHASNHF